MGYTYPEIADKPSNQTLISRIKVLYAGPSDKLVDSQKPLSKLKRAPESKTKHQYFVEVNLPQYGLDDGANGGSAYNLLVFLGNVSSNPKDWLKSEEFAGMASVMGGRNMGGNNQKLKSVIDLSENLGEQIAAGHTTQETAENFLKANLHWRLELVSTLQLLY